MENIEGTQNKELIMMLTVLATDGDFESQKMLSYIYFEGECINKNIDLSLHWSNLAIDNKECNKQELTTISIRIGEIFIMQKKYSEALEQFMSILEFPDLDISTQDIVNISIADVYYILNDDKYLEIYESIANRQWPVIEINLKKLVYRTLSIIYMNKRYFKKAIEIYHRRIALNLRTQNHILSDESQSRLNNSSTKPDDTHIDDSNIFNNLGFANEMLENYSDAHMYYLLAIEKNCSYSFANLNLGYLYDMGLGVEKDAKKAFTYYEKGNDSLEEWKIIREKFKNNQ